jgi:hypothetical protein
MRDMKKVAPENIKAYHTNVLIQWVFCLFVFRQACGERNAKDFAERIILRQKHTRDEKRKHTVQCTIDIKKVLHSSGANMFIIERGESKDRIASVALIYGEDYSITTQRLGGRRNQHFVSLWLLVQQSQPNKVTSYRTDGKTD